MSKIQIVVTKHQLELIHDALVDYDCSDEIIADLLTDIETLPDRIARHGNDHAWDLTNVD